MKKLDVETHGEHYGKQYPAINVKVYHYPSYDIVIEKFKCSKETAERAITFAYESAQEIFWDDVESWAKEVFGGHVEAYAQGRSGGWLVVHNLDPIESWDAIMLTKWASFEKRVKDDIKCRCELSYVLEEIESNEWYKDGSEAYNFVDTKEGSHKCIADLKQEAIKQGFGSIIRK